MRYLLLFLFLIGFILNCQDLVERDSLLKLLDKNLTDSSKVELLCKVSKLWNGHNQDSSEYYANNALKISMLSNSHYLKSKSQIVLGDNFLYRDLENIALKYYQSSLELIRKHSIKDSISLSIEAKCYERMGSIYHNYENPNQAITYFSQSKILYSKTGNSKKVSSLTVWIGAQYDFWLKDTIKADSCYSLALNLAFQSKDNFTIGRAHMISLPLTMSDSLKLLKKLEGLNYFKLTKTPGLIAWGYNGIASCLKVLNKDKLALAYYDSSILVLTPVKDYNYLSNIYSWKAGTYVKLRDYKSAFSNYQKALEFCGKTDATSRCLMPLKAISELYAQTNQFENAYNYLSDYIQVYNKFNNVEKSSQISNLQKELAVKSSQFQDSLKYEYQKEELNKIYNLEREKKQEIINIITLGLIIVSVLSMFLFNQIKLVRNKNSIIRKQKQKVENQNTEILDSINYAKRLQNAILPTKAQINFFFPESFILYKPKQIVSGDFYWLETFDNKIYFAVADCTGHGVPGAMVSVVCSNALSKSVIEDNCIHTGKVLDNSKKIISARFENSQNEIKDGMDISLCSVDLRNYKLEWSGANNPLYIVRENRLIIIKPDKQPVGNYLINSPFNTHHIELQKNDSIYLFTDGYIDQFGGEKGKKIKSKLFKNLILEIQSLTMTEQKMELETFFNSWKKDQEQTDDVTIFGIKIF